MDPTPRSELEQAVEVLGEHKATWAAASVRARRRLLTELRDRTLEAAQGMVWAACKAKRVGLGTPAEGEEWLAGPMTILRNLRLLDETLADIERRGRPDLGRRALSHRPDGQVVAEVFPRSAFDRVLFSGFQAWVWMEPGVSAEQTLATMAPLYRDRGPAGGAGKVALVLGAGNVASIGPMDVLHKLLLENQVCVLKMNPVNAYLGPYLEQAFAPLLERRFLRIVYGGAEEGDFLVTHDGVDEIHITGSDTVHDLIVWGAPGEEQARNKREGTPRIRKPITSELGCVTPVIVTPGRWSDRELDFQAQNIATMVTNNASFNCNAAKVIVTSEGWSQRRDLLERVEQVLRGLPPRHAYYPGSDRKYEMFLDSHPEANVLAPRTEDQIPWTTIFGVDPAREDDVVFRKEAWCGVIAETALPAAGPADFLERAVRFANDRLWGTLSAALLVDPRTEKALQAEVDRAVGDLRYGSVGVNHWPAIAYGLCTTTWGAYPGHTLQEVVSGIGTVHNTLMFERPQRAVVRGPFAMFPRPPWFATHQKSHKVGRQLARFEHDPGLASVLGTAFHALRG